MPWITEYAIFQGKGETDMENKHYDCRTCINKGSPLCELCTQVTKPSGKETKPTYYLAQSSIINIGGTGSYPEASTGDEETEKLAKYLSEHILRRIPLPTGAVLEYNRRTGKEE